VRNLFVESLGTFTSVGVNVPQTMISLRLSRACHHDMPIFMAGKPLVAAPTPIPTDAAAGSVRLQAMGTFALRECARGRQHPLPLVLCLPERATTDAQRIFEGIVRHADVAVDVPTSRILVGGKAIFASALIEADALLTAGTAPACYVGGVDSLLELERLHALHAASRLKDENNSDGFIPGEAAAFLCLSRRRSTDALAWLRGVGSGQEATPFGGEQPNTGIGLTAAVKAAVRDGNVHSEEIAFLAHPASGERFFFNELSLATQRLRIDRKAHVMAWAPGVSVGEVGVAGGPLTTAYMAFQARKGAFSEHQDPTQRPRTGVLCALSDTDPLRGAVFVNEVPRG
jgi:3-oxoacyl-[acyl-carrier-protein] synthase-1